MSSKQPKDQVWDEVLDKLEQIAELNSDIGEEIKDISKSSKSQMEFSVKVLNAITAKYPEVSKKHHFDKIKLKAIQDLNFLSGPKLENFIGSRLEVIELLTKFKDELMKSTRIFADIVSEGPQNHQEAALLGAARTLLEPSEFMNTIRAKETISGTLKRIDSSVLKKLNLQAFVIYHMQLMQNQLRKEGQVNRIGNLVSKEFGVLDEFSRMLEKDSKKPSLVQMVESQRSQNKGRGVDI